MSETVEDIDVAVAKMETTTPTCDKSSQVGNAAAMYEALKAVVKVGYPHNFQHEAPHICGYCYEITTAIDKCFAALATPPRNIDKINDYGEMVNAWNDYVYHRSNGRFSLASFFVWLFDKAKGEAT